MMMCGSVVLVAVPTLITYAYGYVAEEKQNKSVCIVIANLAFYLLFVYIKQFSVGVYSYIEKVTSYKLLITFLKCNLLTVTVTYYKVTD